MDQAIVEILTDQEYRLQSIENRIQGVNNSNPGINLPNRDAVKLTVMRNLGLIIEERIDLNTEFRPSGKYTQSNSIEEETVTDSNNTNDGQSKTEDSTSSEDELESESSDDENSD